MLDAHAARSRMADMETKKDASYDIGIKVYLFFAKMFSA